MIYELAKPENLQSVYNVVKHTIKTIYVFRITIPLDKVAAEEGREQKTLSEREQKIYNMICENLHLSVEQGMPREMVV